MQIFYDLQLYNVLILAYLKMGSGQETVLKLVLKYVSNVLLGIIFWDPLRDIANLMDSGVVSYPAAILQVSFSFIRRKLTHKLY